MSLKDISVKSNTRYEVSIIKRNDQDNSLYVKLKNDKGETIDLNIPNKVMKQVSNDKIIK